MPWTLGPLSSGRENRALFHNLWLHLASLRLGKETVAPLPDRCIGALLSPLPPVILQGCPSQEKATAPCCMCLEALDVREGDAEAHPTLIILWTDEMEINK